MKFSEAMNLTEEQLDNGVCCSCGRKVRLSRFRGGKPGTLKIMSGTHNSCQGRLGRLSDERTPKPKKKRFKRPDKKQRNAYRAVRESKRELELV